MSKPLIVFVHGLGGGAGTWGNFPTLLRDDPQIAARYDVAEPYVYTTSQRGAGPRIDDLALELATRLEVGDNARYTSIVLIGHSMGGLVSRRYIADELVRNDPGSRLRATRLLTFATPHLGSQWANAGKVVPVTGPQIEDLAIGSRFMNRLGLDWARTDADRLVATKHVVAGDDAAVGLWSATQAHRSADFDVVGGRGHISLVKPETRDDEVYQITRRFLLDDRPTRRALPDADWSQPLLHTKEAKPTETNRFLFTARATTLHGREAEFELLRRFLGFSAGAFRWMLLHGPGGVGKSRLALEMCRLLLVSGDWYAGFLDEHAKEPDWTRWQPVMPTAIVIDYAASDPERAERVVASLAGRVEADAAHPLGQPVRVLLIERDGKGEWIDAIVEEGASGVPVKETRQNDLALESPADPWPLMKEVIEASGRTATDRQSTLNLLSKVDRQRRPLFAYFLADALADGQDVSGFDAERLIADVIKRDRQKFWLPRNVTANDEFALALATMTGGLPKETIDKLDGPIFSNWDFNHHPEAFKAMTGKAATEGVPPLEPDIVGEHFVAEALFGRTLDSNSRKKICELAWTISPSAMSRFVVRTHNDLAKSELLALLRQPPSERDVLRYWFSAAVQISTRLHHDDKSAAAQLFSSIGGLVVQLPYGVIMSFLQQRRVHTAGQTEIARVVYTAIEANPRFIESWVSDRGLHGVHDFLRTAYDSKQHRLVAGIYAALAAQSPQLVARCLDAQINLVGAFLDTAVDHKQNDLVRKVYAAMAAQPDRLSERLYQTDLGHVRGFLGTAIEHSGKKLVDRRFVDDAYRMLEADSRALVESALRTPLDQAAAFITSASEYNRKTLVSQLFDALEADAERLVERAFRTPLHQLCAFLSVALKHDRVPLVVDLCRRMAGEPQRFKDLVHSSPFEAIRSFFRPLRDHEQADTILKEPLLGLWRLIAADARRTGPKIAEATPVTLVSLLSSVPRGEQQVLRELFATQKLEHWQFGPYRNRRFSDGAAGLAQYFQLAGRADLCNALVDNLLQRSDAADFGSAEYALSGLSRFVSAYGKEREWAPLQGLMSRHFNQSFLRECYGKATIYSLAEALHGIVGHLPPKLIQQLWNRALDARIASAVKDLRSTREKELAANVRFLAACALGGRPIRLSPLGKTELRDISRLVLNVSPHGSSATEIDGWGRQLWLGLRLIASRQAGEIKVDPDVLASACQQWQEKQISAAGDPSSTQNWINRSMVRWLGLCAASGTGRLVPDDEELWQLAGFEREG